MRQIRESHDITFNLSKGCRKGFVNVLQPITGTRYKTMGDDDLGEPFVQNILSDE